MITEYCGHGDLLNFLRGRAEMFVSSVLSVSSISSESTLYKNLTEDHRVRRFVWVLQTANKQMHLIFWFCKPEAEGISWHDSPDTVVPRPAHPHKLGDLIWWVSAKAELWSEQINWHHRSLQPTNTLQFSTITFWSHGNKNSHFLNSHFSLSFSPPPVCALTATAASPALAPTTRTCHRGRSQGTSHWVGK